MTWVATLVVAYALGLWLARGDLIGALVYLVWMAFAGGVVYKIVKNN